MGCIFSADIYHHFTPRAVYLITHAALHKYDPGNTKTVISWRKYLNTLAFIVGISDMEQAALGDCPEYAEGEKGMSRRIKGKLSEVQKMLRSRKRGRFRDITNSD